MIKKSLLLLCILMILLSSSIFAQNIPKQRVAIITYLKGNVYVKKFNAELWIPAKLKMELVSGDKVWVQQNSQAILQFSDKSTLKLGANTQLDILRLDYEEESKKEVSIFKLLIGKIWATVERLLSQGEKVEVQTPTAIAGVRGTEWIQEVLEDGTTKIWALKGVVLFTSKDKTVEVKEGFQSIVRPGEPPEEPSVIKEIEKFDEETLEEKKEEKKESAILESEKPKREESLLKNSLEYGLFRKDNLILAKLSFTPEISFGIVKLGLDLSLYTNGEDISYIQGRIRYGEINLPWLGLRYGNIDNFNLGYGLIANRYSTYEMDGITLRLEDPRKGGILTLLPSPFNRNENITTTYALRLFYRPLNRLELGVNGMFDLDQETTKQQGIIGADVGYYLTKNIVAYLSFAQRLIHDGISISDNKVLSQNGLILGLQVDVPVLNTVFYLQGLNYANNFTPGYFDAYYEKNKILGQLPGLSEATGRIKGTILGLDSRIFNIASLNISYETFEFETPTLYGNLSLNLSERLSLSLSYEQSNISMPFKFINPNTILFLNVVYPIAPNVDAVISIKRTYDLYGNPTDVYYITTKIRL